MTIHPPFNCDQSTNYLPFYNAALHHGDDAQNPEYRTPSHRVRRRDAEVDRLSHDARCVRLIGTDYSMWSSKETGEERRLQDRLHSVTWDLLCALALRMGNMI